MNWQPIEEKEAERQLIREFAEKKGGKVIKLQSDEDDGGTDGVVEIDGKLLNIEVRRKGYPNHRGKVCYFNKGWDTSFLHRDGGIFLNERIIKNYKEDSFIFLVDIKGPDGSDIRTCTIDSSRVEKLLKGKSKTQPSTNSGNKQVVKIVPLDWFEPL